MNPKEDKVQGFPMNVVLLKVEVDLEWIFIALQVIYQFINNNINFFIYNLNFL
jgi:hypothetical protein